MTFLKSIGYEKGDYVNGNDFWIIPASGGFCDYPLSVLELRTE